MVFPPAFDPIFERGDVRHHMPIPNSLGEVDWDQVIASRFLSVLVAFEQAPLNRTSVSALVMLVRFLMELLAQRYLTPAPTTDY